MSSIAYAALWILIFSLPWEAVGAINKVAIIPRACGALAMGLTLLAVASTGRIRRLHPFHIAALLFVTWVGLELLFVFNTWRTVPSKFPTYLQLCLVLWMIWELAVSWQRILGLLTAYVFGAYVAAFNTFLVYQKQGGAGLRFAAENADPNDLAMQLALALAMACYLGLAHPQPLLRWICRAYIPVALVAVGLTGSRGGMIVTMVALMTVPLTMTRLSPGRLVTALILLVGSGAVAVTYVPEVAVQRLATTGEEVSTANFGGRFKIWMAGIRAFERRPFTGHGTGGFERTIQPEMGSFSNVAHNTYLSVAVEQGLVGLILYLIMFVAVYRAVLRLAQVERRFALVLLAALALAISSLTWEHRKPVWFILAALLGLSQAWEKGVGVVRPSIPARRPFRAAPRAAGHRERLTTTPAVDRGAIR